MSVAGASAQMPGSCPPHCAPPATSPASAPSSPPEAPASPAAAAGAAAAGVLPTLSRTLFTCTRTEATYIGTTHNQLRSVGSLGAMIIGCGVIKSAEHHAKHKHEHKRSAGRASLAVSVSFSSSACASACSSAAWRARSAWTRAYDSASSRFTCGRKIRGETQAATQNTSEQAHAARPHAAHTLQR